jgi:hypothetical protein
MAKHQKKGCTMIGKAPVDQQLSTETEKALKESILGKRIQINVQ